MEVNCVKMTTGKWK